MSQYNALHLDNTPDYFQVVSVHIPAGSDKGYLLGAENAGATARDRHIVVDAVHLLPTITDAAATSISIWTSAPIRVAYKAFGAGELAVDTMNVCTLDDTDNKPVLAPGTSLFFNRVGTAGNSVAVTVQVRFHTRLA